MIPLEEFLWPTQAGLFHRLRRMYHSEAICCKGKYLLVRGEAPILLLAHLDTVHREPVQVIRKKQGGNILTSPQGIGGDDRCGVYALANIYEQAEQKPWLLFTCDEEIGGVGAEAFADAYRKKRFPKALEDVKMLVELDRKGSRDAVYYGCDNEAFEEYITGKGFRTAFGSFSDISVIAPVMGVAAVNLSAGYYHAHTISEYINRSHIDTVIEQVSGMVAEAPSEGIPRYEYIACEYGWGYYPIRGEYGMPHAKPPRDLPEKYAEVYDILLDYFTHGELEAYRKACGDKVLMELYVSVF